ncbi:hypothetical protein ZWY2020_022442 [Hordeum vulgare]|nr:hypothetical protein ZWY2020_022442 [Hordeum vulgare]
MAASGEQQQETAATAKRRVAQPTKKARSMAARDREPEFLDNPVPADEARAKWPQRYQRGSPKWCVPDLISFLSCFSFMPSTCLLKLSGLVPGTQDYNQKWPSQELVAKDLHDTEWKFRHIYRAMALNPYIWDFE